MQLLLQGSLMVRNRGRKRQLLRDWDALTVCIPTPASV